MRITVDVEVVRGRRVLFEVERAVVRFALDQCAGNVTAAADVLGIHRQVLQRKLVKLGLR